MTRTIWRTLSALVISTVLVTGLAAPTRAVTATPNDSTSAELSLSRAEWNTLKSLLNSDPNLTKTVDIGGGARTLTYVSSTGITMVLREPVGHEVGGVQPQFGVGGCGFYNVCIFLNRTDQGAVAAGGAAFLAVAICAIPAIGWIGCGAVTAALTIAAYYIAVNGFCSRTLQIGLLPPGRDTRCI